MAKKKKIDRSKYLRVTEALSVLKSGFDDYLENGGERAKQVVAEKAEFGRQVHELCSKYILAVMKKKKPDEPNEEMLFPGVVDRYRRFVRWAEDNVEEFFSTELEVYNDTYGYLGHFDFVCRMKGDKKVRPFDIKNVEQEYPSWHLQTEAYRRAYIETFPEKIKIHGEPDKGMVLMLTEAGLKVKVSGETVDRLFGLFLYSLELKKYFL